MASSLRVEPDVLKNPQVDVAVPRVQRAEPLGDLAAMLAQIVVLLDERIEPPLIAAPTRSAVRRERTEDDVALARAGCR